MLKRLLAKKSLLIIVAVAVLILGCVILGVSLNRGDSEDSGKSGVSIGPEIGTDSTQENVDEDDVYNGNGLEVKDEADETVDSIDGSGSWNDGSDSNNQKEEKNETDNSETNDTDNGNHSNGDDVEDVLDEDVLVDDKEWSDIN